MAEVEERGDAREGGVARAEESSGVDRPLTEAVGGGAEERVELPRALELLYGGGDDGRPG